MGVKNAGQPLYLTSGSRENALSDKGVLEDLHHLISTKPENEVLDILGDMLKKLPARTDCDRAADTIVMRNWPLESD